MTLREFNLFLPSFALIVSFCASVWGVWRKIEKHQTDNSVRAIRMEDRLDRIEKQFGPNGGGIRQAVNEIAALVGESAVAVPITGAPGALVAEATINPFQLSPIDPNPVAPALM
jgi:hypothetical protein